MNLPEDHPVVRFQRLFARVTPASDLGLTQLYHEEVLFIDPFHRLTTRGELEQYFARLKKRMTWAEFTFDSAIVTEGAAALPWRMAFRSKAYPRHMSIEGVSHLRFNHRISYHRDYFDVSALVAEAIPGVGGLFRLLKRLA